MISILQKIVDTDDGHELRNTPIAAGEVHFTVGTGAIPARGLNIRAIDDDRALAGITAQQADFHISGGLRRKDHRKRALAATLRSKHGGACYYGDTHRIVIHVDERHVGRVQRIVRRIRGKR